MKDTRLDLNRYVRNPFDGRGKINRQLDFGELFRSKAPVGEYPWNNDRFQTEDLIKKFPNNSKFYNILGMILYEEKQYMNSIKNYKLN